MNRNIEPAIHPIEKIIIPSMKMHTGANGIPVYMINMGEEDVIRLDLIFTAGSWDQDKKLTSIMTNQLLKEGTTHRTSQDIAEFIDFYGASIQTVSTHHNSYVTLYTLGKHLDSLLGLLTEIINTPVFPDKELHNVLKRRKQNYLINRSKVQYIASQNFISSLYGSEHPYGLSAEESDYDNLNTEDVKRFHRLFYHSGNCRMVLSGKLDGKKESLIRKYLLDSSWGTPEKTERKSYRFSPSDEKHVFIEKDDAIQSAIRIGLPMINRNHPDFPKVKIVNTILGGYFGSRLMSNIREEKGYTYGIGSGITIYKNAAYLSISTQTDCKYTRPLIEEVYKEIRKLKEENVPEEELEMVRNYMTGEFCRSLESPFSIADTYISLLVNNLDASYLSYQADIIKNITSDDIRETTIRHFPEDAFYEIIAGKMS